MDKSPQFPMVAILVNIRSLHNVGSIFRTADALGINQLYLVGTTGRPHPDAPWRQDHQRLIKTALGAEQTVPWVYQAEIKPLLETLHQKGFYCLSLELSPDSQSLTTWQPLSGPLALIVGHEVSGLSPEILAASEATIHIPMLGQKESLNVSVAFGIAAFWLSHR